MFQRPIYLYIFPLLLLAITPAFSQTISTVAGNGAAGYSGDNGLATSAQLQYPFSVAADQQGNIYIADRGNNCIRKVNAAGFISTFAGTGIAGYGGDGGPAAQAQLNDPTGVAVDNNGLIYIADRGNNRIRKVDAVGSISTVAGTGSAGYSGDNGPAIAAALNGPRGLATDAQGNLYIADQGNQRLRKVDAGGIITSIAGNGTMGYSGDNGTAVAAQLYNPGGVCVDAQGNIYIADVDNERIRKVDNNGIISTIAGTGTAGYGGDNGPAVSAQLDEPLSMAMDTWGNLCIADGWNHRVRMIKPSGIIITVAGDGNAGYSGDSGSPLLARLNHPYGIAINSSGNLYIADYDNNVIRKVSNPTGIVNVNPGTAILEIYPNPNNGNFNIAGIIDDTKARLEVYNAIGQLLMVGDKPLEKGMIREQLKMNGAFSTGFYLLHIKSRNGTTVLPFNKQ